MPYNTEADIATFVNTVWADALLVARDNNVMRPLVTNFGDVNGLAVRKNSKYGTLIFNQIAETDDLTSQAFTPSVDQTLTPVEYGAQVFVTDSRLESDIYATRNDTAVELGAAYGQKIDQYLAGLFPSFTGGTVGGTTTNMTWATFFAGLTKMRRAMAPQPWRCVLTPEQWMCMGTSIAPGVTVTNAPQLQDEFVRRYYVNTVAGVDIFIDGNITAAATVAGGMFSANALALDMRRPFRLEPERDASRRGIELNVSSIFAYGVWRPQYGVVILTAGTAPAA
jgi:hypothetical protein